MLERLRDLTTEKREDFYLWLRYLFSLHKRFLLSSELLDRFGEFCLTNDKEYLRDTVLSKLAELSQEVVLREPQVFFAVRPGIARWAYYRVHAESLHIDEIEARDFLALKEELVNGTSPSDSWTLEVDLGPFNREFFKLKEARSIGRGVEFLNRRLSSQLFQELDRGGKLLVDFLRVHQWRGRQLMLNGRIKTLAELRKAVRSAEEILDPKPGEMGWSEIAADLRSAGFEPGWGKNVQIISETLGLLSDILEAPEPQNLERFLARIPMIFNLLILSPHGYFAQDNVLGRPDTGGQVVYILDQVRALEKEMRQRIANQGLDIDPAILVVTRLIPQSEGTTCHLREEKINGTKNARILRVPFRHANGEVVPQWISRFRVWPYLERFAIDVEKEAIAELGGRPDLIIGNYSDGSLVASLLSERLGVTQCNIAHALEKPKLLHADLYWKDNDPQYHLGCHFTADLISMNMADFIITSSYLEIAGRSDSVGQYESYQTFTMPGLYRVVDGINVFDPKFNIVSPGVSEEFYFPYTDTERRFSSLSDELEELVYGGDEAGDRHGRLQDRDKPLLFTMGRMDNVKNITGLTEIFGRSEQLRERANLLVVAGYIDPNQSLDDEEKAQISLMHSLIEKYQLYNSVRWIGAQLRKNIAGELYRYVADKRGAFVQPALFEAFGLTVIEAMATGLPTFATRFGGPLEIIEHDVSGFHFNPVHKNETASLIASFLEKCEADEAEWHRLSKGAIERVQSRYTWSLHARKLMTYARIYGFWKHATNLERSETRRYLQMFYSLQLRKLAQAVGE